MEAAGTTSRLFLILVVSLAEPYVSFGLVALCCFLTDVYSMIVGPRSRDSISFVGWYCVPQIRMIGFLHEGFVAPVNPVADMVQVAVDSRCLSAESLTVGKFRTEMLQPSRFLLRIGRGSEHRASTTSCLPGLWIHRERVNRINRIHPCALLVVATRMV